jgi:hypothetical protein
VRGFRLGGRAFPAHPADRRPWPDVSPALFESLIVARGLHHMNLTLNITGTDGLEGYIAGHAEQVRAWMRSPESTPEPSGLRGT